jgi:hypothetical protein
MIYVIFLIAGFSSSTKCMKSAWWYKMVQNIGDDRSSPGSFKWPVPSTGPHCFL